MNVTAISLLRLIETLIYRVMLNILLARDHLAHSNIHDIKSQCPETDQSKDG